MSTYAKIFEVQKKIQAIPKDAENPYFKSKYFDVNALLGNLKPVLNEIGLVVIQPLSHLEGKLGIVTIITDPDTKDKEDFFTPLPENNDPQKMGAIITYYRRYILQSLFLLEAEDDDANSVSHKSSPQPAASKPLPKNPTSPELPNGPKKKLCEGCGNAFDIKPGKEWAKECFDCWKKKNPVKKPTEKAEEEDEIALEDIPF